MYKDQRIVVPPAYHRDLILAAHTIAHNGIQSTLDTVYVLYKLRQMESTNARTQGSVNVTVSSPTVLLMKTLQPAPPAQPAARVVDPYDLVFNHC